MIAKKIKYQLAVTYRMLAYLGLDDLTYTHLSARCPENPQYYYIYPLGMLFEEVAPHNLLTVDLNGKVVEGEEESYNKTGYVIHGSIYKGRSDINAIFHLHTTAGIAVSSLKQGLMPLSQFALHFYNNYARHNYDALELDSNKQGEKIAHDLANHKVILMNNHGTLTCGSTIEEAFFYTHHLEQACLVQCNLMGQLDNCIIPEPKVCERAVMDLHNFEKNLGVRDWKALERKMKRLGLLSDVIEHQEKSYITK